MNTAVALAETLAAMAVVGRYPTVTEYANAAPVDRRAILARWKELREQQELARAHGYRGIGTIYPLTHEDAMLRFAKSEDDKSKLHAQRDGYDDQTQTGVTEPGTGRPQVMSCGDMWGE